MSDEYNPESSDLNISDSVVMGNVEQNITMNFGSVMMDDEEELVMPDIPIRPNNAIPFAIGITLILSSLLAASFAFVNFGTVYLLDDDTLSEQGITEEQLAPFQMYRDSGLGLTLGIMYSVMTLGLIISGILLMRKNPLGVKLGIGSGAIFVIAKIVDIAWVHMIAEDYGMKAQISSGVVIQFLCGAFCMALPLVAILIPEGRAALYREKVILKFSEEE